MKLLMALLLVLFSGTSFAGGDKEGNGGGSIVCIASDGTLSAKLLDLREEEQRSVVLRSDESKEIQLERALKKLEKMNPELVRKMRIELSSFPSKIKPVQDGVRLAPPTDTSVRYLVEPRNCSLEGVANFNDVTDELQVDSKILAAMSNTDLAALEFHEALYRVERLGPAKVQDSVKVRKLTGAVFSSRNLVYVSARQGLDHATSICNSADGKFQFYVVKNPQGGFRLQFTKLESMVMAEQTIAEIPAISPLSARLEQQLLRMEGELDPLAGLPVWMHSKVPASSHFFADASLMLKSNYGSDYPLTLAAFDQVFSKSMVLNSSVHVSLSHEHDWFEKTAAVSCKSLR